MRSKLYTRQTFLSFFFLLSSLSHSMQSRIGIDFRIKKKKKKTQNLWMCKLRFEFEKMFVCMMWMRARKWKRCGGRSTQKKKNKSLKFSIARTSNRWNIFSATSRSISLRLLRRDSKAMRVWICDEQGRDEVCETCEIKRNCVEISISPLQDALR